MKSIFRYSIGGFYSARTGIIDVLRGWKLWHTMMPPKGRIAGVVLRDDGLQGALIILPGKSLPVLGRDGRMYGLPLSLR